MSPTISQDPPSDFAHLRGFGSFNLYQTFIKFETKFVTSRVFTRIVYNILKIFSPKFHDDWAKNVTSRGSHLSHYIHIENNAPPTATMFFHRSGPFSSNSSEISIKTNVLTNFHDDWAQIPIRKTAPPTGGHVFQRTGTTFEFNQYIIQTTF
ncbi:hypothetical protein DPMN_014396 [Dreissena polymorpha]|uniref:Uncharacterized protein n=1 Tax=Dreissena polymorpha TaxID=45954 RepID=A0A9D4N9M4_DREPO|nr:hypothetical protein DPMN_014396 [Dreissena polymorpha]